MRTQKFSSLFLISSFFLLLLPLSAQVHGVPASVSSFGFGGNISPAPGVPASVTSLGPNGFNFTPAFNGRCCFNSFFPGQQFSSLPGDQFRSRLNLRSLHRHHNFGPIFFPAYSVPYTQVVVVPEAANGDEEEDYAYDNSMFDRRPSRHPRPRQDQDDVEDARITAPSHSAAPLSNMEPISAQPSTILIFKDGHKLDVENYAIVGETLFEFANGFTHKIQLADLDLTATEKANEDRGVEFRAPSTSAQ